MAWMEEKLQPVDLLSLLQMKRQRDEGDGGNSNSIRRNTMELEQLKAMQEQNKMAELKRGLLTPSVKNPVMDSPYSIGFPAYQAEQDKMRYAAMATGQSLPNQGFHVSGGGGSSEPTPGDLAQQAAQTDLLRQQGNLAEEQGRMAQQQRSGYGSATKDLLAQQKLEMDLLGDMARGGGGKRGGGNYGGMPNAGMPESALRQTVMSGGAIQSPEEASAIWTGDRKNEYDNYSKQLARDNFLAGGGDGQLKDMTPEEQLAARGEKNSMKATEDARKVGEGQAKELRQMTLSKLKEDRNFKTLTPEMQQATLEMDGGDRTRMFEILSKLDDTQKKKLESILPGVVGELTPGSNIRWGKILSAIRAE
jgi:hypothetical protein